jgi:hypothetical protein
MGALFNYPKPAVAMASMDYNLIPSGQHVVTTALRADRISVPT